MNIHFGVTATSVDTQSWPMQNKILLFLTLETAYVLQISN